MTKFLCLIACAALTIGVYAQPGDIFTPYQPTHLRLPSVPLILSDPYFSIWSPYDRLTEGSTKHWTDEEKPLEGLIRVDNKTYRWMGADDGSGIEEAQQRSVDVLATNTYYSFDAGAVHLTVVFTAPMIMKDYDLMSSPINYISFRVEASDSLAHSVQLLIAASPLIAVNEREQPTISEHIALNGREYLKTGTIEQPILAKKGDGICIDWGYFYLSGVNGALAMGEAKQVKEHFIATGAVEEKENKVVAQKHEAAPLLTYTHDFGYTTRGESFMMLGYDEVYDIEYFYKRYKAFWAHEGKTTIFDMFNRLERGYTSIMERCRQQDKTIYDDGLSAGNEKYAEILSAAYRHVNAAHKLFRDERGNILFFSKENNSNGCVNTVDLTYPESPLYLSYDPTLLKGMMSSILDYAASGRWTKPFAAHDLGTYPKANGQAYGGDMPLEESGNMLILAAMICKIENNSSFVDKYWDILSAWADYLSDNGQYPTNQLCTDDFAGHWAGNCNLTIKAFMGVAGYAEMAKMKGLTDVYNKYNARAKEMAATWERETKAKDHYLLAYDAEAKTWSQKYNMIWDKLWKTEIIPNKAMTTEVKYYLKKQNTYGLPLDSRKDYTKTDWLMWTAAMAETDKDFLAFVDPVYRYIDSTPSRVPISDWSDTKTAERVGFKARSVIGGYWMRVLERKLRK